VNSGTPDAWRGRLPEPASRTLGITTSRMTVRGPSETRDRGGRPGPVEALLDHIEALADPSQLAEDRRLVGGHPALDLGDLGPHRSHVPVGDRADDRADDRVENADPQMPSHSVGVSSTAANAVPPAMIVRAPTTSAQRVPSAGETSRSAFAMRASHNSQSRRRTRSDPRAAGRNARPALTQRGRCTRSAP
jgi:hypothetical protein